MDVSRCLVAAVALGVAFVPLAPSERSSVTPPPPAVTQTSSSEPSPNPEMKMPRAPQVDVPNPSSPDETTANAVSGAVGDITSGLDGFAGLWVDGNGLVRLAVQQGHANDVKGILGDRFKGEVVVVEVQRSYRDLVARRDSISTQIERLAKQGLSLMEWGPDEEHNTVWISLIGYTEAKAELARKLLGQDIVVKPSMTGGGPNDLFSIPVQAR